MVTLRPQRGRRSVFAALPEAGAAGVFAIVMVGTTLPTPLYGLYRQEIGFSELMVTVIFAVYAVAVMGVLTFGGGLSDVVGRRRVALVGVAFAAASAVCFLTAHGLPLLFAGRLCSGFSAGLFTGAATAYVVELAPPEGRNRAALVATAANMGGLGLGPVVSGTLAQYAPWPLRLPYAVHLALLAVAAATLRSLPETVPDPQPWSAARVRLPAVPASVRAVFVPSAVAGFAGFALLGVFTSVAPAFLSLYLGVTNLAVVGLVVLVVFAGSMAGQLLAGRMGAARALPVGCGLLVVGLVLLAGGLEWRSLALLVLSAVIGGAGQGFALRGAVSRLAAMAPAAERGQVISAFFLAAYAGISLPVVGIGLMDAVVGLQDAGLYFAAAMAVLAAAAGGYLLRLARYQG
ncbi:MFS transporter [Streptacidiphilus melanogenes]|uniref:MFS transporter n=1 Tax=Streptacidiphilus melanogenes TaxID=411235 RepID=UPI0022871B19|nr:MFS transporter [Streptacidiphilus melanogenes]